MNLVPGHFHHGSVTLPGGSVYQPIQECQERIVKQLGEEADIILGFRPEAARFDTDSDISADVIAVEMNGSNIMLDLHMDPETIVRLRTERGVQYGHGESIKFGLDPQMVRFFNPKTKAALRMEN
jgi:ABC-type sugar transport system ATPase subunit